VAGGNSNARRPGTDPAVLNGSGKARRLPVRGRLVPAAHLRIAPSDGLRIGLLGGSFNPAHDGHRHVALVALHRLRLDAVWWLVSPQNPLKSSDGMAGLADRVASARAVARHPRFRVTTLETTLGTRFTADTIPALCRRFPRTQFVWLMGADNLFGVRRWQRWSDIFRSVPVAVVARAPYSVRAFTSLAAQRFRRHRLPERQAGLLGARTAPAWVFLHVRRHPASSTEIRRHGGGIARPGSQQNGD